MKTRFTEMLGIEYPIMCGGMMRLNYPPFCAAISNAGGLGNLTSAMYKDKAELTAAIREVRELTDKPLPRDQFKVYDFDNLDRPERMGKLDAIVNHMGNFFDCIKTITFKFF